jgi:amino acid adenylation domain-containing protein
MLPNAAVRPPEVESPRRPGLPRPRRRLRRPRQDVVLHPASFAQQRLWFLDRLEQGSTAYHIPLVVRLSGELDAATLGRALAALVQRHEVLRSTFVEQGGAPYQAVGAEARVPLPLSDLSGMDSGEEEARRLAADDVTRPFDLARDSPLRARLIRLGSREHVLVLVLHHVAADGWSLGVLQRDLGELYAAEVAGRPPALPELVVRYGDYAAWQRERLRGDRLERELAYWRGRLSGVPFVLDLPADRPRPHVQSLRGAHERRLLPASLVASLQRLAAEERATLFMALLAAYSVLLSRYAGQDNLLVATPVAGRTRFELEDIVGFFANTLLVRADLDGDPSFRELLRRTRGATLDALEHQELPFEKLVAELNPARELSHSPLAQVLFSLQHAGGPRLRLPGLEVTPVDIERGSAKFDLALFAIEREDGVVASLEYATDLFDGETAARMLGHLERLLASVVAEPDVPLGRLELLTEPERRRLAEWNETAVDLPPAAAHELVAAQARRTPGAAAVSHGGRILSYAELEQRADALAARLQELGVGPGAFVAVCLERSADQIVAVLATLKAGGAVAALEATHPEPRLRAMLDDLAPRVLLVPPELAGRLPATGTELVVGQELPEAVPETPALSASDPAYVVFTSGSTGRPKGVVLPHLTLANLVAWQTASSGGPARTLQFASLGFDVAFQEIFSTLAAGGTLVLVDEEIRRNPETLLATLAAERVERLFVPYAALHALADEAARTGAVPESLREVVTAGEPLRVTPALRRLFSQLDGCVLQHQYGASEFHTATQLTLAGRPERWPERPSLGGPIANVRLHVLDRNGHEVPVGVPGELHVAGPTLGLGYLAHPELTAECFVPDPFVEDPQARMYRTGDLVRRRIDGSLDYVGRSDDQVKIRGYRVEPGEVESVLAAHPDVREAAVVVHADGAGGKRLVAYVATAGADDPDLAAFVRERLPAFMVPAQVVAVDTLPTGPNGKVDQQALARLEQEPAAAVPEPPRDELERALEAVWRETLGVPGPLGIHDDFFELGGHSLLAVALFSRIERELGVRLPLVLLFEDATIAGVAAAVRRERGQRSRAARLAPFRWSGRRSGAVALAVAGAAARARGVPEPAEHSAWSPLVPLRPDGPGRPLFLVHGMTGELIPYRSIVQRLPAGRPVYGLQSVGLDGRRLPHRTIEQMAREYVGEIRRLQPRGPYLLAGLCFGGVVAYEMGRQLAEAGEEASLLALIDAQPFGRRPLEAPRLGEWPRLRAFLAADLGTKRTWLRAGARRWWLRSVKRRLFLATGLRAYDSVLRANRPSGRRLWGLVYAANVLAMRRYATPPADVRVTLLQPEFDGRGRRSTAWTELAGRGVDVRPIVATGLSHYGLTRPPLVDLVAGSLAELLHEADPVEAGEA